MDYEVFDSDKYNPGLEQLFFLENKEVSELAHVFDKAYLFSNENLNALFSKMDVKNKTVATVGSSGDQLFNLLYHGSRDITVIDRSLFFEQFIELKKAAIRSLPYSEFMDFMFHNGYANIDYYRRISYFLNKKSQIFWDMLFLYGFEEIDRLSNRMFQHLGNNKAGSSGSEFYCNEESFNKLKEILNRQDYKITYITSDLFDFPKRLGEKKFDLIMLSNIVDHLGSSVWDKYVKTLQEMGERNLNDGGKIQFLSFYNGISLEKNIESYVDELKGIKIEYINIGVERETNNDYLKMNGKDNETLASISGVIFEK